MAERKHNLWVVEDDESIAQCLVMLLENEGYQVHVANSLTQARALSASPDLVLLDFLLPDGNGIAYISELAEAHPGVHIILLTALDRVGASRFPSHVTFQPKPFHNRELMSIVRSELKKRAAQAAAPPC